MSEKLPKQNLVKDEVAKAEQQGLFKPAPPPKKISMNDLWLHVNAFRSDVEALFQAVNALAKENIKSRADLAAAMTDLSANLTTGMNNLNKAFVNAVANMGSAPPVMQTGAQGGNTLQDKFDKVKAMVSKLPYASKIKVTMENAKVVVRKSGYLGSDKIESDARYKEFSERLKPFGIKWVRGGGPKNDYRWES